ncbi:MAG: response regulator transcription factor [Peptococcaceae bacterium]|nr:response regulator transcription factor [Peptococcaceae bacterium]
MRILIVEDEKPLADAITQLLRDQHYDVDAVYDGKSGLDFALIGDYALIILDVMLPLMNGFDVVKALRQQKQSTPVLMLTAREATCDKITGLDCGADDYMTKPFDYNELFARVRALTRRVGEVVLEELSFGDLTLNLDQAELSCANKTVHLSYKEFAIMKQLMQYPSMTVSKETLIVNVWGSSSDAVENNVEVYISFLRKKLRFLDSHVKITTLRRLGYRLEVADT